MQNTENLPDQDQAGTISPESAQGRLMIEKLRAICFYVSDNTHLRLCMLAAKAGLGFAAASYMARRAEQLADPANDGALPPLEDGGFRVRVPFTPADKRKARDGRR